MIEAPQRAQLVDVARPAPAHDQVLIRIEGCGVCGSDLAVWQGRQWFDYPLDPGAPGHEAWGTIEETGEDVKEVVPGQRVAAISYRAHAEYDVAEAAAVVPVPTSLGDRPFPGEALGCAMNVYARSEIEPHHTVAVVGIGFLGALVTQMAVRGGARVIGVSRRAFSLEVARAMGAHETVRIDDTDQAVAEVKELTDAALCDRVVEAAGLQTTLDIAAALTRTRGRLIIAGYHQDGARSVDMQMWNWRGIDVINAHERALDAYVSGVRAAAVAIDAGRLDPSSLYTHSFAFDDLARALDTAARRPDGFLKAVTAL